MEKKTYVRPLTDFVFVQVKKHLLEASPVQPGPPGGIPDARERKSSWDDEE